MRASLCRNLDKLIVVDVAVLSGSRSLYGRTFINYHQTFMLSKVLRCFATIRHTPAIIPPKSVPAEPRNLSKLSDFELALETRKLLIKSSPIPEINSELIWLNVEQELL